MYNMKIRYVLVGIFVETPSMFKEVNPHHSLVDSEDDDVWEPEEGIEERHVHIVVVTIIGQSSVSIFQQGKSVKEGFLIFLIMQSLQDSLWGFSRISTHWIFGGEFHVVLSAVVSVPVDDGCQWHVVAGAVPGGVVLLHGVTQLRDCHTGVWEPSKQ